MKKLVAVLLVFAMGFSIVACSQGNSKKRKHKDRDRNHRNEETEETEDTEETEETSDETEETSGFTPSGDCGYIPYYMTFTSEFKENPSSDNWTNTLGMRFEHVAVASDEFPALVEAVNNDRDLKQSMVYNEYASRIPEFEAAVPEDYFYGDINYNTTVYRSDSVCFSYAGKLNTSVAGDYSDTIYTSNFDSLTGEEITLDDVVTDIGSLTDVVVDYFVTSDFGHMLGGDWGRAVYNVLNSGSAAFTLVNDGIIVYISSEVIIPDEMYPCITETKIPFIGNESLFNESYFNAIPYNYCIYEDASGVIKYDFDEDGVIDTFTYTPNGDEYWYDSVDCSYNDIDFTIDAYGFSYTFYIVHIFGHNYLYCQTVTENDYYSTTVYEINESSVTQVGDFGGRAKYIANPESFELETRIDPLSTMDGYRVSYIDSNGLPESSYEYYLRAYHPLTSTVGLEGDVLDSDGFPTGETREVAAGSMFIFFRTDNETFVDFIVYNSELDTSETIRFDVSLEWGGGQQIEGMTAYDCFEMLYYAG